MKTKKNGAVNTLGQCCQPVRQQVCASLQRQHQHFYKQ